MRRVILFIMLLLASQSFAQLNSYSANDLDSLQYVEKRPVVFFINTDWCSICLAMENKVLKSQNISELLNEKYHLVLLNAEGTDDIVFKGKRYVYEASGVNEGKHQLARQLAKKDGTVAFPSTVIMVGNSVVYKNNSFITREELKTVLDEVLLL